MLKLLVAEVVDQYIRRNFQVLQDLWNGQALLKGKFKFVTITVPAAVTAKNFNHDLGFLPKDVIMTSVTNGATVTWNYASFTSATVNITTTAACTIRAFLGSYGES